MKIILLLTVIFRYNKLAFASRHFTLNIPENFLKTFIKFKQRISLSLFKWLLSRSRDRSSPSPPEDYASLIFNILDCTTNQTPAYILHVNITCELELCLCAGRSIYVSSAC